jgi:hypothetical protein
MGCQRRWNAIKELQQELQNKLVTEAHLDGESGDLLFQFSGRIKFQVLNLTGYEVLGDQFSRWNWRIIQLRQVMHMTESQPALRPILLRGS